MVFGASPASQSCCLAAHQGLSTRAKSGSGAHFLGRPLRGQPPSGGVDWQEHMSVATSHPQVSLQQGVVRKRYVGEVVYIYAYDVAYEMSRSPVRELFGQPVKPFEIDKSKRSPRQLFFHRPQTVSLPALQRVGPHGP